MPLGGMINSNDITYADLTELESMPKLRVLTCDQITYHEKQNLKKSFPLVRFGGELSPADEICDVETK